MKKLFYSVILFIAMHNYVSAKIISSTFLVKNELSQEKEYKKITPEEVNKEALMNIKAKYGDYQIVEAAVSSDGEYKLTLKKDNASITTLFTSSGDLIKIL